MTAVKALPPDVQAKLRAQTEQLHHDHCREHDEDCELMSYVFSALVDAYALGRTDDWRNAALRVGEEMTADGPHYYYTFTAVEWRQWAMRQLTIVHAGLKAGAERILELELENATLAAAVEAKERDCVLLDAQLLACAKELDVTRALLHSAEKQIEEGT